MQRDDPTWMIDFLRAMQSKRRYRDIRSPWNAFESVFADWEGRSGFDMDRCLVAMLYHTFVNHLKRHVPVFVPYQTGSLWDYVPGHRPLLVSQKGVRLTGPQSNYEMMKGQYLCGNVPNQMNEVDDLQWNYANRWMEPTVKFGNLPRLFVCEFGHAQVAVLSAMMVALALFYSATGADPPVSQLQ